MSPRKGWERTHKTVRKLEFFGRPTTETTIVYRKNGATITLNGKKITKKSHTITSIRGPVLSGEGRLSYSTRFYVDGTTWGFRRFADAAAMVEGNA